MGHNLRSIIYNFLVRAEGVRHMNIGITSL